MAVFKARFKKHRGMNMFEIKQGCGTTNDGNTARAFFKYPARSAQLLQIDECLIIETKEF